MVSHSESVCWYNTGVTTLLEAKSLTKHYGRIIALDSVDFEVQEGITGLLGPNGAGKSTAIKLFLGLLKPTSGSAEVLGELPYESVDIRARLGYMPEHDCLPTAITASEFLTHMVQVSGIPPSQARTRAADILRHVGLEEERYRPIGQYSTGMKQRVKLAQSLAHDPVIVLLDEPTAGLDPSGREDMLRLIRRTGHEFGISIILSSHLMGDVESTCDRIIVLEGGHVTEQGAVSQFTQETETVLIDVDGNREELITALAARGVTAVSDGVSLAVDLDSEEQYDAIRDALVETNARLRRMSPRRHQLTDIFRTTLGLGRGAGAKVLPMLLFGAAMAPAIIIALIVSLTNDLIDLPGHPEYYQVVSIVLLIFAAIIAPELLCADRRNGVISLYLVRPLSITDYVAARWLAFFAITLLLVYSGQIVLLAGLILSASDPVDYIRDNW